jgi:tRNA1(Val) A37 N6-methylase TrmN6
VLLAWWVGFSPGERILDAGCGVGVVALALARCRGARDVLGVELQPALAALARANVVANGAEAGVSVREGDLRELPPEMVGSFDVVCANPPFREAGGGRVNPSAGKAAARHELTLTLDELARAAAAALRPGGRFYFIHQPRRLPEIMAAAANAGLRVERLRFVQPAAAEAANLVLGAARAGGSRETTVMPPLVIYGEGRDYGPELAAIYAGDGKPLYGEEL